MPSLFSKTAHSVPLEADQQKRALDKKRLASLAKANTARQVRLVEKRYQAKIVDLQSKTQQQVEAAKAEIIATEVPKMVQTEIEKARTMERNAAMRFRMAPGFNAWANPDVKPGADATFSHLRRLATVYPVARACINRRIRQITQLKWDVTTIDELEAEDGYEEEIKIAKLWLKQPMGHKTRTRELLSIIVDDILTLDATSFEYQKKVNGEFMYLIPVDPTTIVLRLTETGGTPVPPEIAYAQIINGIKVAEFTTDEFLYESMNSRSYSPYGLAPLESLLLQAEAALRGTLYNLNYFKENNIPEGFIGLPEEVATTPAQIEEWQSWFDSILAGDMRTIHRLKILPGGAEYTPAKKPEDMSFEKFELWLLQLTCAVFDVPPQDIGITYQVNKATGETQTQLSNERGLYPLANFIKEILDDIVQTEMMLPSLQVVPQGLDPVDLKQEAEIAEKEINMGALSVDEYRQEHGREPIGLTHYVKGSVTMLKDVLNPPKEEPQDKSAPGEKMAKDDSIDFELDNQEKLEILELRRWRKCLYKDLDEAKPLRTRFPSKFIRPEIHKTLEEGLKGVSNRFQVKLLFDQFLDQEVKAAMDLLQVADDMREAESAPISP